MTPSPARNGRPVRGPPCARCLHDTNLDGSGHCVKRAGHLSKQLFLRVIWEAKSSNRSTEFDKNTTILSALQACYHKLTLLPPCCRWRWYRASLSTPQHLQASIHPRCRPSLPPRICSTSSPTLAPDPAWAASEASPELCQARP